MRRCHACHSPEHALSRRQFLTGLAAGAGGLGFAGMVHPAAAAQLKAEGKRVLLVWLAGGVSQLETWDPKPGTDTGGPFQAIPTSVPGVHISELLPHTARQMHRMALVRGVNTRENDHGKGAYIMHTGRRQEPATDYPYMGPVMARLLGPDASEVPASVTITPGGSGMARLKDVAFLGPKYASINLRDGAPPANLARPDALTAAADRQRQAVRERLNQRFARGRRTAETEAYTQSYEQALQLMERRRLFDVGNAEPRDLDRYGPHDFGRHCLLARRLLEAGVTFVKLSHAEYDTHHENFDFHLEQLGEFDLPFATLLQDLHDRGLLASTLVVVMSEFGRTPTINRNYGRDHWGSAWSVALAGCGIQGGAAVGKTNKNGTAVAEREVDGGHLFHTYFRALGLDPARNHYANGRPIPMADPKSAAIREVLA